MELRGGERFGPLVVRHHDQRAGRAAGARARDRWLGGVVAARRRGEEYLLERKLFRRKSTGEVVDPAWLQFSFPTRWHYDVLRALEYFREAGDPPDPRLDEAIELLRSKQQPDGTWLLENTHPGAVHFALEDGDGRPSRWNTLRALRVLAGTTGPGEWSRPDRPGAGTDRNQAIAPRMVAASVPWGRGRSALRT